MIKSFDGGAATVSAYEVCMTETAADLIVIKGALGDAAIAGTIAAARLDDPEARTPRLQEVLGNALPLTEAEALIPKWVADAGLPAQLRVFTTIEGPAKECTGRTRSHFDQVTATQDMIYGPFAISIGTVGSGLFKSRRLFRRLTMQEVLGIKSEAVLDAVEFSCTEYGEFSPGQEGDSVVQNPGDIVLIPGTPQPSLHAVEVGHGVLRQSVVSSYLCTPNQTATPAELRRALRARRQAQLEELVAYRESVAHIGNGY